MREYMIEQLPYRPMVTVDYVPRARLPRIADLGLKLAIEKGYRPDDPKRGEWHLNGDINKPPRVVAQLIISQGVHRLSLDGLPPTDRRDVIDAWIHQLPDEAILLLLKACVQQTN
jgi:hypothetical protein